MRKVAAHQSHEGSRRTEEFLFSSRVVHTVGSLLKLWGHKQHVWICNSRDPERTVGYF